MSEGDKPYRPNVGIALFNRDGLLFLGRAREAGPETVSPGRDWQCPQGGIDAGEDIIEAARRELYEETNVRSLHLLEACELWWHYDFPPYDGSTHKLTPFRGQRQRWVAFLFTGNESEIDVVNLPTGEPQEFLEWRWGELASATDTCPLYKAQVYTNMAQRFAHLPQLIRHKRQQLQT